MGSRLAGTYSAVAGFAAWTLRHEARRAALVAEKPHLRRRLRPVNVSLALDAADAAIRAARVLVAVELTHGR